MSTRTNFSLRNMNEWQREVCSIYIKLSHHKFLLGKQTFYIKIVFTSCYNAENKKHEHTNLNGGNALQLSDETNFMSKF